MTRGLREECIEWLETTERAVSAGQWEKALDAVEKLSELLHRSAKLEDEDEKALHAIRWTLAHPTKSGRSFGPPDDLGEAIGGEDTSRAAAAKRLKRLRKLVESIPRDEPTGMSRHARRRQRLVQDFFSLFLDQQGIAHRTDEHGVTVVELPRNSYSSQTVPWTVAFDRRVATERIAELVNFTNPRFQRLRREIGSKPVLAYRIVRRPNEATTEMPWQRNVVRTDFGFHIIYKTYGQTREELFTITIGPLQFAGAIVADAYHPQPLPLPPVVADHYQQAMAALHRHLETRTAEFADLAARAHREERARLDGYQQTHVSAIHGQKALADDNAFYDQAIERKKADLASKYSITIDAKLLTVEPFFSTEVA